MEQESSSKEKNSFIYKISRFQSSLAGLISIFAGGNLMATLLSLLGGLLVARAVEPAVLGLFTGLGLVLKYGRFLQLGILNGLGRELPYHIGRNEPEEARELAAAAQAWALLVGGLMGAGLLGVALSQGIKGDWQLVAGWSAYAFGVFVLFFGDSYLQITYRTYGDFARLAVTSVTQKSIELVMVVAVRFLGFYGLCLRSLVSFGSKLALLWHWRPLRVASRWNLGRIKQLFKVGAPIFLVGQIWVWWTALDLTLVLHHLGTEGLGLYQLAIITYSTSRLLPDSLSQIVYPRMSESYGRNGQIKDLVRIIRTPIFLMVLGAIPAVLIGWHLIPPVTKFLLPQYQLGIPAAQWTLVSASLLCLAPVNNIFNVIKRQSLYIVAMVLGMATHLLTLFWLNLFATSLVNFAQAMLLGKIVFIALSYLFLAYLSRQETQIAS